MIPHADDKVVLLDGLGFGYANVVVAVPQAWIDVRSMADLDDVATAFRLKHDRRMRVATKYVNLTRGFFAAPRRDRLPHRRELGRDRGRARRRHRRADRRHHHHRRDARRQRPQGDRRRHHPALAGEPGGGARRRLERGRARDRPPACSTASSRRRARAPSARCAPASPGCDDALLATAKDALRRGGAVRRPDLVGHADAALPAARRCTRWRASCASMAPRRSWSPSSTTCSRATIRSTRSWRRDCRAGCILGSCVGRNDRLRETARSLFLTAIFLTVAPRRCRRKSTVGIAPGAQSVGRLHESDIAWPARCRRRYCAPNLAAPPFPANSLQTPVISRDAAGQTERKSPIISICEVGKQTAGPDLTGNLDLFPLCRLAQVHPSSRHENEGRAACCARPGHQVPLTAPRRRARRGGETPRNATARN